MKVKQPTDKTLKDLPLSGVAPVKGKNGIPLLKIDGRGCSEYNAASAAKKTAERTMESLKPLLTPQALRDIFTRNCAAPVDPTASVKLVDGAGATLRVTASEKYGTIDVEQANRLFTEIKRTDGTRPNINNYLQTTVIGSFDSKCFLSPTTGRFDEQRFNKIKSALDAAAAELGCANPVTLSKQVTVLPSFLEKRWERFDAETNFKIQAAIPMSVSLTPVVSEKPE